MKSESSGQISMEEVLSQGIHGEKTDVGSLATYDSKTRTLSAFVWHYHDNNTDFPDADISLGIKGLPPSSEVKSTHYRVDDNHSNSYTKWLAMGSPQTPNDQQFKELVQSGKLTTLGSPHTLQVGQDGKLFIEFSLPIRALSLIILEYN